MFINKTAKFAPIWTTILKIRAIVVRQTLTEHALVISFEIKLQMNDSAEGNLTQFWELYP